MKIINNKKILFISLDSDLYLNSFNKSVPGDPYLRHCKYQNLIRKKTGKNSEMIVIVYSNRKIEKLIKSKRKKKDLQIIGTNSINRFCFTFDVIKELFILLINGWIPNVITTQNSWGEAIPLLLISKIIKCKFIPQMHTDISSKYWIKERPLLNRFRRITAKIVFKYSSTTRIVSKRVRSNISEKLKINNNKFKIAPVAISLDIDNYDLEKIIKERIISKEINILYIGRFSKEKDLKLWINTSLELIKELQNINFTLIGYGPEKDKIKKFVENSGYRNKFHFMDKVNYENVPNYLIKSHLLLLTSFYEGFGRVILEAMTFGIPCVSTKSGGPEDLIKRGLNGFIVDKRDPIELAKKCSIILKNKSKYQEMSKYAHLNAIRNYSFEKLSNDFIDLILGKSK